MNVLVAINIDDSSFTAHFDAQCGMAVDLITDEFYYSAEKQASSIQRAVLKMER